MIESLDMPHGEDGQYKVGDWVRVISNGYFHIERGHIGKIVELPTYNTNVCLVHLAAKDYNIILGFYKHEVEKISLKACPLEQVEGRFYMCMPEAATHLKLNLPGPPQTRERVIPIQTSGTREGTPNWTWNGDVEQPTLRPSLNTKWEGGDGRVIICHSHVEGGHAHFLSDTTHEYSGHDIRLLDVEFDLNP